MDAATQNIAFARALKFMMDHSFWEDQDVADHIECHIETARNYRRAISMVFNIEVVRNNNGRRGMNKLYTLKYFRSNFKLEKFFRDYSI